MCGLAAFFAYDTEAPEVEPSSLMAANEAMAKRGPDGKGLWISESGRVGLAHRRLAIIDLSEDGAQPMQSGPLHITYNGEIYNYQELKQELEAKGVEFKTRSDTEVLLQLYRQEGAAFTERLRGMYAFAIWDEDKQGLLLGRDPFGVKPLYYLDDGKSLMVASQVKALLAQRRTLGLPTPSFDPAGHVGFFLFGSVPEPHTLYQGIKALEPGTTLWVGSDGEKKRRIFFDLADRFSRPAVDEMSLADLLRDSVNHHLVSDVPVGVFLSSGLDSATLVALAAEKAGGRLDTLTLGFEEFAGTENDEVPLAEDIARSYGTRHHTVRVSGREFAADLETLLNDMDQPSVDGVNTYFVAKAAKSVGLKVAISGLGGDELFRGYDSFSQIPKLVNAVSRVPFQCALGRATRSATMPFSGWLLPPKAPGLLEYGGRFGDAYLLRRALHMPWELDGILDPDMIRDGLKALDARRRLEDCLSPVTKDLDKVAVLEMGWYMRNQLLRDADWAGMAHSLEIRVPLVDVGLFGGTVGRGFGKQDMAATPSTKLSSRVLSRSKTGFFVPVHEWMGAGERGLRGWAQTVYRAQTAA